MEELYVPKGVHTKALLLSWHVREGDMSRAELLAQEIREQSSEADVNEALAQYAASCGDMKVAWSKLRHLSGSVFNPDRETFALVKGSSYPALDIDQELEQISIARKIIGDPADPTPCLMSICRILPSANGTRQSRTEQALALLEACTFDKVPLTAALAYPVKHALWASSETNQSDIRRAISFLISFLLRIPPSRLQRVRQEFGACPLPLGSAVTCVDRRAGAGQVVVSRHPASRTGFLGGRRCPPCISHNAES